MLLFINNLPVQVNGRETIPGVLSSLEIHQSKGIALAVNDEIIVKEKWDSFELKENDKITVIKASQGG